MSMVDHFVDDPAQGIDVVNHQMVSVCLQQADFFQVIQFPRHAFPGGVGPAGKFGMGRRLSLIHI